MNIGICYISPARFTDRICGGKPSDASMRRDNYELCQAIDTLSLSVILERMVKEQGLSEQMANIFHAQAASLRAALLTENHRLHNF